MARTNHCCWVVYTGSREWFKIMATTNKHISLPQPFNEGDPTEWFQKYKICCVANDWSDELKNKKLPTLLEGEALAIWLELTTEQQENYQTVKSKIIERMGPVRFVSFDDFQARKLQPNEALSVFLHDLKQLLKQAIPEADACMCNQLLLHQFVNGLPGHISKQLRATGEVNDLDRVMERAKLLIMIDEPQRAQQSRRQKSRSLKNKSQCLLNKWQHCLLDTDNQQLWYVIDVNSQGTHKGTAQ